MPIEINSFMGRFGWIVRKYFPKLASDTYLRFLFVNRRKLQQKYVGYFMNLKEVPMPNIVNIETINKCNSTCSFCFANIHTDKRPLRKMDNNLYKSIIDQLAEWGYKGHLTLFGNNEPWLDSQIIERHKYAREKLPNSFIFMSTNGLTLDINKVKQIQPYINQLIINNYSMEFKLHKNIQEIYDYVKSHLDEFNDLDIKIQMRYLQEILTNKAGTSPNKQTTNKVITETCLFPYTDMWIMPNGKLVLCCCDSCQVTEYADLAKVSLKEGWVSKPLMEVRKKMASGRYNEPFCRHCDFIDAGAREDIVRSILSGRNPNYIGGHSRIGLLNR